MAHSRINSYRMKAFLRDSKDQVLDRYEDVKAMLKDRVDDGMDSLKWRLSRMRRHGKAAAYRTGDRVRHRMMRSPVKTALACLGAGLIFGLFLRRP